MNPVYQYSIISSNPTQYIFSFVYVVSEGGDTPVPVPLRGVHPFLLYLSSLGEDVGLPLSTSWNICSSER
jgi:hypothetical protein